jgi:hypothetical protein
MLLDTVLTAAFPVDETEDVRCQGRTWSAADLRVDALGLRLERQAEDPLGIDRRADPVGDRPVQPVAQDDVSRGAAQPVAERRRGHVIEGEDACQFEDGRPAPFGSQSVGGGDEPLALDGRGEHDRPGPVVDVAALAGRLHRDRRLRGGLDGKPLTIDDLPVG